MKTSNEQGDVVNIVAAELDHRTLELVEALRRGRPSTVFNLYDCRAADCPVAADWFVMLQPDARGVFNMLQWMKRGAAVITVDSEISELLLDDDCALIFGPDPTDEEFVRGMIPFLESGYRMKRLSDGAQSKAEVLEAKAGADNIPVVSVILLCYNQKDTVIDSIESVLGQVCDVPFEIIVADDGSTDGTRELIEDYAARYPQIIKMLTREPNKGVVDNYFDAFEHCRGDFFTDCAGDDYWVDPLRLQKQVDYLRVHPADVAVMSDWLITENGKVVKSTEIAQCPQFSHGFTGQELIQFVIGFGRYLPFISAMLMRSSVVREVYANEPDMLRRKDWGMEDVPLLFQLGRFGDVGYLPLIASAYNVTLSGISSGGADNGCDFMLGLTRCVLDLCTAYKSSISPVAADGMNARLLYVASLILENPTGKRIKEFEALCESWPVGLTLKLRLYRMAFKSGAGMKCLRCIKGAIGRKPL